MLTLTLIWKIRPFHVVKFAIVGNDQTIHNTVGSYVAIRATNPRYGGYANLVPVPNLMQMNISFNFSLFENIQVQFYYIPVTHSNFATFLARSDGI